MLPPIFLKGVIGFSTEPLFCIFNSISPKLLGLYKDVSEETCLKNKHTFDIHHNIQHVPFK